MKTCHTVVCVVYTFRMSVPCVKFWDTSLPLDREPGPDLPGHQAVWANGGHSVNLEDDRELVLTTIRLAISSA